MPSPDARPYVDLTLYDLDAQAIYLDALERVQQALPEWQPREGQIEVVLLQALAYEVAETVASINRIPNSMTEILLRLFNIERASGSFATATVRLTSIDDTERIVPAGTRMFYTNNIDDILVFSTDGDLTLSEVEAGTGRKYGEVGITATNAIGTYNGVPEDTFLTMLSPSSYISSAVLVSAIVGGGESESDTDYFNRAMLTLSRLTDALVLPDHFETYTLGTFSEVRRVKAVDYVKATPLNEVPPKPNLYYTVDDELNGGYLGIFALLADGASLDAGLKDELRERLNDKAQVNLEVDLFNTAIVDIRPTIDIVTKLGYTPSVVVASCVAAVKSAFNINTTMWADERNNILRPLDFVPIVAAVPGVERVEAVSLAFTDGDDYASLVSEVGEDDGAILLDDGVAAAIFIVTDVDVQATTYGS